MKTEKEIAALESEMAKADQVLVKAGIGGDGRSLS
jgi:preprotein translocase subunit YajC